MNEKETEGKKYGWMEKRRGNITNVRPLTSFKSTRLGVKGFVLNNNINNNNNNNNNNGKQQKHNRQRKATNDCHM